MTRVVVTGFTGSGTSTVTRDEELAPRPGSSLFDVWAYDDGPVLIPAGLGDGREFRTHFPAENGVRVYTGKMAADGTPADDSTPVVYPDLVDAMTNGNLGPDRSAGFHASDTIDVAVIISGEMGLELGFGHCGAIEKTGQRQRRVTVFRDKVDDRAGDPLASVGIAVWATTRSGVPGPQPFVPRLLSRNRTPQLPLGLSAVPGTASGRRL